jgi:hypothetical protein
MVTRLIFVMASWLCAAMPASSQADEWTQNSYQRPMISKVNGATIIDGQNPPSGLGFTHFLQIANTYAITVAGHNISGHATLRLTSGHNAPSYLNAPDGTATYSISNAGTVEILIYADSPFRYELDELSLKECAACAPHDVIWHFSDSTSDLTLTKRRSFEGKLLLEHVYDWANAQSTETLVASDLQRQGVYVSDNLGSTWSEHRVVGNPNWQGSFTTHNGTHLLWDDHTKRLRRFSQDWNELAVSSAGTDRWLGSWSIGQHGDVIMYAEYAFAPQSVSVWRSTDDGASWTRAFKQRGTGSSNPQIRHFHLLQPDPYRPGDWYLSSGDRPEHSHIWRSSDDGLTWTEITPPSVLGTADESLARFTAMAFTQDFLYWGTDDTFDGRDWAQNPTYSGHSKLVRAGRGKPLQLDIIGELADRPIRNLTVVNGSFVLISESRGPGNRASAWSFNDGRISKLADIPVVGPLGGFTFSVGSLKSRGGGTVL